MEGWRVLLDRAFTVWPGRERGPCKRRSICLKRYLLYTRGRQAALEGGALP